MDDCIFCKIAEDKAPCYKVYENKDFVAFLDIRPINSGHTLVIPKKHYRWVWDVENFGEYCEFVKAVTKMLIANLGADSVHYITLGESVLHAHIHIVPRYKGDGLDELPNWSKVTNYSQEEMEEILKKITKE